MILKKWNQVGLFDRLKISVARTSRLRKGDGWGQVGSTCGIAEISYKWNGLTIFSFGHRFRRIPRMSQNHFLDEIHLCTAQSYFQWNFLRRLRTSYVILISLLIDRSKLLRLQTSRYGALSIQDESQSIKPISIISRNKQKESGITNSSLSSNDLSIHGFLGSWPNTIVATMFSGGDGCFRKDFQSMGWSTRIKFVCDHD
jgi:hypothetical protein